METTKVLQDDSSHPSIWNFYTMIDLILSHVDMQGMTLVACGWNITVIDDWISPFSSHDQDRVLMQFRTDEWIHLCHVAAQPARIKKREFYVSFSSLSALK